MRWWRVQWKKKDRERRRRERGLEGCAPSCEDEGQHGQARCVAQAANTANTHKLSNGTLVHRIPSPILSYISLEMCGTIPLLVDTYSAGVSISTLPVSSPLAVVRVRTSLPSRGPNFWVGGPWAEDEGDEEGERRGRRVKLSWLLDIVCRLGPRNTRPRIARRTSLVDGGDA